MGLYKKMSISDIEASFERLVNDPSMRSLSAVLRIGQEQLDSRGRLGKYRNMAFVAGMVAVATLFVAPFLPARQKFLAQELQIGAAVICVLCVAGLWRVRGELEKNLVEEVRLRKLILSAAQRISTQPTFNPGPLTGELKNTLKESIRQEGYEGDLENLLDVH